jgi:acylphosphatase
VRIFSSIPSFSGGETRVRVICKKCLVGGRVQGVFYRATAARRAQDLGVSGYARNLADGRVEVLACGEEPAVLAFVNWLWIGSSASRVTSVDVTDTAVDAVQASEGFHTT